MGCSDLSWPCIFITIAERTSNKIADNDFSRDGLQMRMVFFSIPNVTDDQVTRNQNCVNESCIYLVMKM